MWDNLFSSVDLLQKGLDATWLRNEVINNNIANADTPGFKSSEVEFEELMNAALNGDGGVNMAVTDERHISKTAADVQDVTAKVNVEDTTSSGLDENNVEVESEMVALAKNSIEYYTLVSKMNSEFGKLKTAIGVS